MGHPTNNRRVALVTGAAGGLGQAQVRALSSQGIRVIAHARTVDARLSNLIAESGATPLTRDLETPDGCRALVGDTVSEAGRLDVLVANHAAMTMASLVDADPTDWWRVAETNLLGTFALLQEATRVMRAQGSGGRIIVISSEWGLTGWPDATAYAGSKAGLLSLVKCLGRELAPEGILVNAVAPGVIDTPQLAIDAQAAGLTLEEMRAEYASKIPMGRIGCPEEVAAAVQMLANPRLIAMAGQTISINGGSTRGRA